MTTKRTPAKKNGKRVPEQTGKMGGERVSISREEFDKLLHHSHRMNEGNIPTWAQTMSTREPDIA